MKKLKKLFIFTYVAVLVASIGFTAQYPVASKASVSPAYVTSYSYTPSESSEKDSVPDAVVLTNTSAKPLATTKTNSTKSFFVKFKNFFVKLYNIFKDIFNDNKQPSKPNTPTTQKPTQKPNTTKPNTTQKTSEKLICDATFLNEAAARINKERRKAGVPELKIDANIAKVASVRAKELKKSFSHTRPDGRKSYTVYTDLNIKKPTSVGENIAVATKFMNATDIVEVWVNSPAHKENMLNKKFTRFGMAWYITADGKEYAVMELGND